MNFFLILFIFFDFFLFYHSTPLLINSLKNTTKLKSEKTKQEIEIKSQILNQLSLKQFKILNKYTNLKKKSDKSRFLKAHSRNLQLMSIIGGVFGGIIATRIKNEVDLFFKIRRLEKTLVQKENELNDVVKKTRSIKIPFDKQFNKLTGNVQRMAFDISHRMQMANNAILDTFGPV